MSIWQYDSRRFFLAGMRFFFGGWLLYVGLVKWVQIGPETFVGYITGAFDKTWSPHALNVFLAGVILVAEPLVSLWILSGFRPRCAWTAAALLMFLLTVGQTILMKPDVYVNWLFLVLALGCAALSDPEPS